MFLGFLGFLGIIGIFCLIYLEQPDPAPYDPLY